MLKTLHCFPPFFGHWHSSLVSDTHYEHSIPVWVAHWPFLCLGLQLRAFRLFEALSPSPVTSNQRMDMPLGDEMALSMGRTHNRGVYSSVILHRSYLYPSAKPLALGKWDAKQKAAAGATGDAHIWTARLLEKKWETRSRATSLQGQHMKAPKVCLSQLLEFHPSKGRTIS